MKEVLRVVTDAASISALFTISLYHLLSYIGRSKQETGKTDLLFSLFIFSLTSYLFFDNTLPFVFMNILSTIYLTTTGVAVSSLLIMVFYLFFMHDILHIRSGQRKWIIISCIIGFFTLLLVPFAMKYGYEWYMYYLDKPAVALYLLIFVLNTITFIKPLKMKIEEREKLTVLIFFLTNLIILALFIYRVMIAVNIRFVYLNKTIFLILIIFMFPVLLTSKANREFRELIVLKERLKSVNPSVADIGRIIELYRISEKEQLVMTGLIKGLEYKEIADELNLSLSGVKKRVHSLYRKTDVQNRTELVNKVLDVSVIEPPA